MEQFKAEKPKKIEETNKYSNADMPTLEANKKDLEHRYDELMNNNTTDLENTMEIHANAKEIPSIQNEILEIENEIKRRMQNN